MTVFYSLAHPDKCILENVRTIDSLTESCQGALRDFYTCLIPGCPNHLPFNGVNVPSLFNFAEPALNQPTHLRTARPSHNVSLSSRSDLVWIIFPTDLFSWHLTNGRLVLLAHAGDQNCRLLDSSSATGLTLYRPSVPSGLSANQQYYTGNTCHDDVYDSVTINNGDSSEYVKENDNDDNEYDETPEDSDVFDTSPWNSVLSSPQIYQTNKDIYRQNSCVYFADLPPSFRVMEGCHRPLRQRKFCQASNTSNPGPSRSPLFLIRFACASSVV
ncbi:unnamed protein product [Protopolystoma xenopodis]|uniref:Uncharacterized protein n=1 Tax=Protopolystoma xenopodis TaxID=117903 RepID=A0A3S5AYP2_9PLAT|nr:unnamed protein product [Protopolystoma xenopodis]